MIFPKLTFNCVSFVPCNESKLNNSLEFTGHQPYHLVYCITNNWLRTIVSTQQQSVNETHWPDISVTNLSVWFVPNQSISFLVFKDIGHQK